MLNKYVAFSSWGDESCCGECHIPILANNKKQALKIIEKDDPYYKEPWTIYTLEEWFNKFRLVDES